MGGTPATRSTSSASAKPGIEDDIGLTGQEISDARPPNPPISPLASEATRIPVRIRREDPLRLHRRGRHPSASHDASAHAPPRAPNCDHKSDDPRDDDRSRAPRPSEPGEVARRDEPNAPEEEQDHAEDGEGEAGRTAHGEMVSRRLDSPPKHYTRNGAAGMWTKRSACALPEVDGIVFRQSGDRLGIAEFEAVQRVLGAELEPFAVYPKGRLARTFPAQWQLGQTGVVPWRQREA